MDPDLYLAASSEATSPWIPFLSALAGGLIGGSASVVSVILNGRQQAAQRKEERVAAKRERVEGVLVQGASEAFALLLEAVHFVGGKTPPSEDYEQRVHDTSQRLQSVQGSYPSPLVAGLAGDVAADLNSVLVGLKRQHAEESYPRDRTVTLAMEGGQAVTDLMQELRKDQSLQPIPEGRLANPAKPFGAKADDA